MVTNFDDTIAGISTAPGIAGISVIRISGEAVFKVINSLFRSKKYTDVTQIPDKTIAYGWIETDGKPIDEVLLSIMHKPHTFTAEDIVEIPDELAKVFIRKRWAKNMESKNLGKAPENKRARTRKKMAK